MRGNVPWVYALVLAILPGGWGTSNDGPKPKRGDDRGQISMQGITGVLLGVLALVIVVFLLAGVADPYFNATENITDAVETASTGNDTIDALLEPFGILIAGVLVVGFVLQVVRRV